MNYVQIDSIPGDKSLTHRAIILGSLAEGETEIRGYLKSDDCLATRKVFELMGVSIRDASQDTLLITGVGLRGLQEPSGVLDTQNSGTTMRLLLGVLAGQNFHATLTGDQYLRNRPMLRVVQPLQSMGTVLDGRSQGKFAPLSIRGGSLTGITYQLPVASAQVKSALLLAGLYASGVTTVIEPISTRDHTERMLSGFGIEVHRKADRVSVSGGDHNVLRGTSLAIPADFSSAAFWIVAGLLKKDCCVQLKNIGINPGRSGLLTILKKMGAQIALTEERLESGEPVTNINVTSSQLTGTVVQGNIIPSLIDEIPILAVAAAFADGVTEICDAAELRVKETDRIAAMATELRKLGVRVDEKEDGMIIHGGGTLHKPAAKLDNYGDHRIAMACSIAGLCAFNDPDIIDGDCIETSYPQQDFYQVCDQFLRL